MEWRMIIYRDKNVASLVGFSQMTVGASETHQMTVGAGFPSTATSNLAVFPWTAWQFLRPLNISGTVAAE